MSKDDGGTVRDVVETVDGEAAQGRGDEPPELTDEDESILKRVWAKIAEEEKTAQINSLGRLGDGLLVFAEGDVAYLDWLRGHPEGFVVNVYRNKTPDYMVLHKATCTFVSKYAHNAKPGAFTKREFIKICSIHIPDLSAWAIRNGREDGSFTGKCSCRPV